jgi:hypothetical protein
MDVPWKVIFAFVGVFIAGAIFGGVFTIGASARRAPNGVRGAQVPERPVQTVIAPVQTSPGPVAAPAPPVMRPNPITVQLLTQFTRRLSPTPDQRDELRKILGRAGEDLQRLRQENLVDVTRVTERMYADISAVLTLDQRSELEKMRRQEEERVRAEKLRREQAAAAERASKASGTAPPPRSNPTPPRAP